MANFLKNELPEILTEIAVINFEKIDILKTLSLSNDK